MLIRTLCRALHSLRISTKNFGGMQKAFVNYSIEFTNRGIAVLFVARKRSVVEKQLHENGVTSVKIVDNKFGFQDIFAIRSITKSLSQFFGDSNQCFILTFGARATLFAGKAKIQKSQHSDWKVIAMLPNSTNYKYYRYTDLYVPSTKVMANADYQKNLVNPIFSEVIPRFSRVTPVSDIRASGVIVKLFAAGRFVPKKGFNHLIEAVGKLAALHPTIKLSITGDGPQRDHLAEQCRKLNLDKTVEFLGYRNDVPDLIADSDLLIVPSVNEPFGNILLEGMAVGTPIVTTRSAGALELLNDNTARFANIASSDSLAEAISNVVSDPQSANERAKNALGSFKLRYTPDIVIPKVLSILERMD